jgi:hypothetical protein
MLKMEHLQQQHEQQQQMQQTPADDIATTGFKVCASSTTQQHEALSTQ